MPYTLKGPVKQEFLIKKSRFISCVQPVEGHAQALAIVQGLRDRHPGAADVCRALLAGSQSAANDDGEPGGTAGRPMLEVLRHQELEGVMATVVHHYGDIRLDTGGLIRAYTDAVARERQMNWTCLVPYAFEGWVRRELQLGQAQLLEATHGSVITIGLRVAETQAAALQTRHYDGGLVCLDEPQE